MSAHLHKPQWVYIYIAIRGLDHFLWEFAQLCRLSASYTFSALSPDVIIQTRYTMATRGPLGCIFVALFNSGVTRAAMLLHRKRPRYEATIVQNYPSENTLTNQLSGCNAVLSDGLL